jgi:hypothetical protein
MTRATLLLAILSCIGCSNDNRTLTGAVTLDGQPIPKATIQFDPDAAKGNVAMSGSSVVVEGRYKTREGFGVSKGPYVVTVVPPETGATFKPHVFHVELTGSETTMDFDVPVTAQIKK